MEKLNILWTTDNKDTIYNMLFMYATNSKTHGWWPNVNVIIWGALRKTGRSRHTNSGRNQRNDPPGCNR